ncbi:glucuronate isomerase [Parabacteroides bouchesdurhonensis]|uniref:glucuronate isomerase n=1 Tax=Parabacteroides bouchesdurhonensis TaxID=1936995 RepID=UPI000E557F5F|nr:glucuronate isomerase [Parabacteroides bouchesdurhonensis]RHJ92088.1 glucuronate isomerase [Bacteroides sp. AM07-16]
MKPFIGPDFLLDTDTARMLYHEHAANMPVIDYHCHLDPKLIAEDYCFENLTEIWLDNDHYKWRAMRANGIAEEYITGNRTPFEKFRKWAETVPYTMRNPLYHWTHMELSRVFGIEKILNPSTAREIYNAGTEIVRTKEFSVRRLIERMKVEILCTTNDPTETLEYHQAIRKSGYPVQVLPAWRPDKVMAIEKPKEFNAYLTRLGEVTDMTILSFRNLVDALQKRHRFFTSMGCYLSDFGLETFYAEPYTEIGIEAIFLKARMCKTLTQDEINKFRSAILYELAAINAEVGWVQQFHIGANRNNNTRMFRLAGADSGFDAIGDKPFVESMNRFFSRLDEDGLLAKTILYNLNPKDNALVMANIYNFNDGTIPGKMQYGAAWWFLDNIKGIEEQLNTLSSMGLLSRFVGMSTDSRSFLSYPRHEYFRRILCNLIGNDIEGGRLPSSELPFIQQIVEDICYYNAKRYFNCL